MAKKIKTINPFILIKDYDYFIDIKKKGNDRRLEKIITGTDLLIVAADDPSPFALLRYFQRVCFTLKIPFVSAGMANGFISPLIVPGVTPCIECVIKTFYPSRKSPQVILEKGLSAWMSVPFYYLQQANAILAQEIWHYFAYGKTVLNSHFFRAGLKKTPIKKRDNCPYCAIKNNKK